MEIIVKEYEVKRGEKQILKEWNANSGDDDEDDEDDERESDDDNDSAYMCAMDMDEAESGWWCE